MLICGQSLFSLPPPPLASFTLSLLSFPFLLLPSNLPLSPSLRPSAPSPTIVPFHSPRSLGVVLYVMLTGEAPFTEDQRRHLYTDYETGHFVVPSDRFPHVSTAGIPLLLSLIPSLTFTLFSLLISSSLPLPSPPPLLLPLLSLPHK